MNQGISEDVGSPKESRWNSTIIASYAVAVLGAIGMVVAALSGRSEIGLTATMLFGVGAIGAFMRATLSYLERASKTSVTVTTSDNSEKILMLEEKVQSLLKAVQEKAIELVKRTERASGLSQVQQDAIVSQLKESILSTTSSEILSELKKKLSDSNDESRIEARVAATFGEARIRLYRASNSSAARGRLNLVVGSAIAMGGLLALLFDPFQAFSFGTSNDYVLFLKWGLRIAFTIAVELLAYFFLRAYRASIDEEKYFQNEITNIESRQIALDVGLLTKDQGIVLYCAKRLAACERNFVISKDQTTVDIERSRLDATSHLESLKTVADAIKAARG